MGEEVWYRNVVTRTPQEGTLGPLWTHQGVTPQPNLGSGIERSPTFGEIPWLGLWVLTPGCPTSYAMAPHSCAVGNVMTGGVHARCVRKER